MIRIDEIYNHTFWPWIQQHRSGTRLFYCDPFGASDPDSIQAFLKNVNEHSYIFMFDQEPVQIELHAPTFERVVQRNRDLGANVRGAIITSEKHSESVQHICEQHNWKSLYYFFHGWAALDWYRGYDRTFLIQPWQQRKIRNTFISPNRIIAGERKHRLEMLYYIFKNGMTDNHISCPLVCPAEHVTVFEAIKPLVEKYSDIKSVFANAVLPQQFKNETDHPMHSCWLSLFDQCAESLLYLVTETVATGRRYHLTEKTFKPIAMGMPFIIVGTRGSLRYLREYGFRTFEGIWDESYDDAEDDVRIQRIASLLRSLDELPVSVKQDLFEAAYNVIEHNWNHFYHGGFEKILWAELTHMLASIDV